MDAAVDAAQQPVRGDRLAQAHLVDLEDRVSRVGDELVGNQQQRDYGIKDSTLRFQMVEPLAQKMQNQEEIADDEDGINGQFDRKRSQAFGSFFFHEAEMVRR